MNSHTNSQMTNRAQNENSASQSGAVSRMASIDIGTVTCRLLLADVSDTSFTELERQVAITNLGIGVDKTHLLQDDAIDRAVTKISEYLAIVDNYKTVDHPEIPVVAVATSASRDAKNSAVLVDRLREIGVELRIIEGIQEARLSFRGASRGYEGEQLLVADIGGGSTELVLGLGGDIPRISHSFNIGCRRMTERFMASNPPTDAECAQLRAYVREEMASYFTQAKEAGCAIERIVAVAGTPTSVVAIDKHMEVYDSSRVHGTVVPRETLQRIYDNLRAIPLEERKGVVGLEPARASVIVAGLAILLEVLDLADCSSFTVSESDILQGILLSERE